MQLKQLRSISGKSSTQILGKSLGLIVTLGILGINVEKATAQVAQLMLRNPTATFTNTTITGYTVTVILRGSGPLSGGVTLQYQDSAGVNIGLPLTKTLGTGAGGVLTVPPPPIPAGATGLGNQVIISAGLLTSKPLIWYNSSWLFTSPKIKIDPLGIPGLTTNQSWFIEDTPEIIGNSSEFGTVTTTVIGSNFDLQYTDLGSGLFEATVVGDNSFMKLANDTYISFSNGLSFGNIQIDFNDGTTANGTFNFSAIGLDGLWDWNSTTNYTGGTGTPSPDGFDAPAISVATTPEPTSTLSLLSLGILGAGVTLKRKVKRTHSTEKEPANVG